MKGLVAAALLLLTIGVARAELPAATAAATTQALASGRPSVIDLGARTCIPCKEMAPILEALAADLQGKANVLFIDVREDGAAAGRFRIQMIPTQIFFDAKGNEIDRHVGFMDREGLLNGLHKAGLK